MNTFEPVDDARIAFTWRIGCFAHGVNSLVLLDGDVVHDVALAEEVLEFHRESCTAEAIAETEE